MARTKLSVDKLSAELSAWQTQLEPLRDEWTRLWRQWLIVPDDQMPVTDQETKPNPYLSRVRVPYGFHAVETITPRITGTDPTMSYRALDDPLDQSAARLQGGLVSWQMERMGFRLEARRFIRQGLVTGFTVAKHGWIREVSDQNYTVHTQQFDPGLQTVFTHREQQTQKVAVRNGPFFETVSVFDFVWPIQARNLDECTAVWQRRYVTMGYLKDLAKQGVYKNVDKIQTGDTTPSDQWRRDQFDAQGVSLSNAHLDPDDPDVVVEIWERWTDDYLCVVASPASSGVIIREDDNPFAHGHKPFVDWAPVPHPFQMPGVGIIQVIADLNEDLNTIRRQRRDALTMAIGQMYIASEGFDFDTLPFVPGRVIEAENPDEALKPLLQPPVDFTASNAEEERIILDMQNLSGAFATLSGSQSDSGQAANTATGISTLTSEGNKRIQEMINEFADRSAKRFGYMAASMNAQFIDAATAVEFSKSPQAAEAWQRIVGDQPTGPVVVDADYFKANGRLEPIPDVGQDEDLNKVQRRSDAVQIVQAFGPFLAMVPPPLNMKVLIKQVAEAFDLSPEEINDLLDNSAEQQKAMLQQVMQQQAKPNGSGPSGPSGDPRSTGMVGGAPGVAGA